MKKIHITIMLLMLFIAITHSQKPPSQILPDSRLKGNWKSEKLDIMINIQRNGDVDLTDSEGHRTGGIWRSGISGGKIPEGESISFLSNWNKYIYGLSEIKFESKDTLFASLSNTQTTEIFIRQDMDYTLNSDDHPHYWEDQLSPKEFIAGKWIGNKGYYLIEFKDNGTFINTDKYGNETSSTWEMGTSYKHEKYKNVQVFPLSINCCYDESSFEIYNTGYDNFISLRSIDSRGRSQSSPIMKDVGFDKGSLTESQFAKIKTYFTGIWMTKRDVAMFSANHGINLKEDGTFTTEVSLGESVSSSLGKSGKWSIYYDERGEHKTLYLDLYTSEDWTIHPTLKRFAINIESIEENGFVSWEVTKAIYDSYSFKKINNFDEIYDASDGRNAAIFLGLIVVKSIVEGVTEEESARNYFSKKGDTNRRIEVWNQEDANWRRDN